MPGSWPTSRQKAGSIPPGNLARSRVYLFTGQADKVVNSKTVELGAELYRALGVPQSQIVFRDQDSPPGAGHSWVTRNSASAATPMPRPTSTTAGTISLATCCGPSTAHCSRRR